MKTVILASLALALGAALATPAGAESRHHRHHAKAEARQARTVGRVTPETPNGEYSRIQSPYNASQGSYPQWAQNALGREGRGR
jgi:hypothetical protein